MPILYRLYLKDNITLGEGRGNTFIAFLKKERIGDCGNAINSKQFWTVQWKLCQKAKHMRKPLEEDDRKAVFAKSDRPVVCPAKAGVFSRRQSCHGKSQKPCS